MKHVFFKAVLIASCVSIAPFAAALEQKEKRFPESQYRHDMMEIAKLSVSNIVKHFKGQVNHDGHIAQMAEMLAMSAALSKATFEKDTRASKGHTEAQDKVWENWEDFSARMDTYAADTKALAEAMKTGDSAQIRPAFGKALKNCKSCHDIYRK